METVATVDDCKKYEARIALPFVGIPGYIYYAWELFGLVFISVMFINVYNSGPFLPMGLCITSAVVGFGLWLFTIFYSMPYYATKTVKGCDDAAPAELIMTRVERTYPDKVRADLKAHNDQEHFQGAVLRNLFTILFLSIFLYLNGLDSFQPIPFVANGIDIMNFVISKGFQVLIMGSFAWSFYRLGETQSDFLWRHMTAMNAQYNPTGKKGEDLALGNIVSGTRNRGFGLFNRQQ